LEIASLHAQIGGDILIDCPREFAVEFPSNETHQHGAERQDAWYGNEAWFEKVPGGGINLVAGIYELCHGLVDLIHLDSGVYHHAQIVDAQANDLNGVLQPERIPDEEELVDEAEDEDGEVGGDGKGGRGAVARGRLAAQGGFKFAKDICLESQADQGLDESDEEEGPCPARVGQVAAAFLLLTGRIHGGHALTIMVASGDVGLTGVGGGELGGAGKGGGAAEGLVGGVVAGQQARAVFVARLGRYFGGWPSGRCGQASGCESGGEEISDDALSRNRAVR
jgi:hypothetical protein